MMCTKVLDGVRSAAHFCLIGVFLTALLPVPGIAAPSVTLAWDPCPDPTAAGYNLYYGPGSRNYTNIVDAANTTSISVSNLVPGATYYFAATTYNSVGLESDFSLEVSYAVPDGTNPPPPQVNVPPTLDQSPDVTVDENSGPHTVNLTGISSGSPTENQTLVLSAFSSNPSLIPQPVLNYTSPNSIGTLTFTPAADSYGSNRITVSVFDGGTVSNTTIRSFSVIIRQVTPPPPTNNPPTLNPITDLVVDENSGPQTVTLTGITAGAGETQTLAVTAQSSNTGLIPTPVVSYRSPAASGSLTFTPAANQTGSCRITVSVDDGQSANNLASQSFLVTVQSIETNVTAKSSVVYWQRTDGVTAVWKMDGTNSVQSARLNVPSVSSAWKMVGQADFDGDGHPDILWQNSTDGAISIWLMNETNRLASFRVGGPAGTAWRACGIGDLSGDGHTDIVWQHTSGSTAVWFMDGTNCTGSARLNVGPVSSGWRLAAVADLNLDGRADLLWQHTDGSTAVWMMDGTNRLSSARLNVPVVSSGWSIVGVADLNGPTHTDILWQHNNGSLACWLMDGTNRVSMARPSPSSVDPCWRAVAGK